MHVAICDDNVGDRKQLERLLHREADKRANETKGFYIDSYGHSKALLKSPRMYDLFIIDMCRGNVTGIDVVNTLVSMGIHVPVVLCSSQIAYRDFPLPDFVLHLDKPIKAAELSKVLDYAVERYKKITPAIEIRTDTGTFYVDESEILYAVSKGRDILVQFTSGKSVEVKNSISNFFSEIEQFPSFLSPSKNCIVNGRYIANIGFSKITMADGKQFKIALSCKKYARYAKDTFSSEKISLENFPSDES